MCTIALYEAKGRGDGGEGKDKTKTIVHLIIIGANARKSSTGIKLVIRN